MFVFTEDIATEAVGVKVDNIHVFSAVLVSTACAVPFRPYSTCYFSMHSHTTVSVHMCTRHQIPILVPTVKHFWTK